MGGGGTSCARTERWLSPIWRKPSGGLRDACLQLGVCMDMLQNALGVRDWAAIAGLGRLTAHTRGSVYLECRG